MNLNKALEYLYSALASMDEDEYTEAYRFVEKAIAELEEEE